MKDINWRKIIAILIINLFLAGAAQIGLSTSIKQTDLTQKASKTFTTFDPFMEGWMYRKQITIDHTKVASDLVDFPVFISITDSDLQAKAQTDGDDILFMDDIGNAQQLNHEIESYDETIGELFTWINIPSVSSTEDTIFYMYYGNSGCSSQQHVEETWNDYFMAVWHLQNDPAQTILDSTLYNNDGIAHGTMSVSDLVDGMAGKCLDFDGVDDYISVPDSASLKPTDLTLVAWYQPQDLNPSAAGDFLVKQSHDYWGNPDGRSYGFWRNSDTNNITGEFEIDAYEQQDIIGNLPMEVDTWSYLVLTFHKAIQEGIFYVNGALNGIKNPCHDTVLWYDDPWDFNIGGSRIGLGSPHVVNSFHNCALDEIRIVNTALSAEWISTEFNNQNDPSSFYRVGIEEIKPRPPANPQKPYGPILGEVDVEYVYATSTTDPDGDLIYYQWDWGDGTVSDWFGPFNSGVVVTASHSWSVGDDYQIKVKAKDFGNLESSWSESLIILIDTPPTTPERPSGSIKGDVGIEYTFTTTTTDTDTDTLYYMWSWGDGNISGWYGPSSPGVITSASHVWTEKGTYEIKVKAKDEHGFESDWSEPLSTKMPFSYQNPDQHFFEKLFERFPHAFPLIRYILGY